MEHLKGEDPKGEGSPTHQGQHQQSKRIQITQKKRNYGIQYRVKYLINSVVLHSAFTGSFFSQNEFAE